jgi:hypothetical protein
VCQAQTLAPTPRRSTVAGCRGAARHFPGHPRATFPRVRRLSPPRRDPHLPARFRRLCEQDPPLRNQTRENRLPCPRRLLDTPTANGRLIQPGPIRRENFPPHPCYPPRPLSPEDDRLRRQELRRTDDLPASALPLTRATGIRIGECIDPAPDCPRPPGPEQWALHIPIGKLHTERLVPADEGVRRILALRAFALPTHLAKS